MADNWQTYSFLFQGGLITNLAPYQHGIQAPGSARILRNFEPSVFGGYRRVEGYTKYDIATVPNSGNIRGIVRYGTNVYAARGDDLFRSSGTLITAKVNGAVTSSATVTVDTKAGTIATGMQIVGTGITGTVTVNSISAQTTTTATVVLSTTVTIANDVDVTFSAGWTQITDNGTYSSAGVTLGGTGKVRFLKYDFDGTEKILIVDATGKPFRFDGSTFAQLSSLPTSTSGASFVVNFKNHVILGNGKKLIFSAPYEDDDFTVANGGGEINIGDTITGLIVFREQLVIFSESSINVLNGNSVVDFTLQPVSRDLGCVAEDTVQEIGGDILFLGPDGLRTFSATDKIGDFSLAVVSKPIQTEMIDLIGSSPDGFNSTVIREKRQYRIFGFNSGFQDTAAKAVAGTQLQEGLQWNDLRGFNVFSIFSEYDGFTERIYFGNSDGYIYQMEQGNTQDGTHISATFATPFVSLQDSEIRKTIYKGSTYLDVNGTFDLEFSLKFDFDQPAAVQPDSVLSTDAAATTFFGSGIYGTSIFGTKQKAIYEVQTVGSGFTVSILYETTGEGTDNVFSIDAATLEYAVNDRR